MAEYTYKEVTPEMREALRNPLPKEAIKSHPSKQGLSTIKAIFVFERLNDVFGVGRWRVKTDLVEPINSVKKTAQSGRERTEYTALMKTILEIPEYGIYHECIAGSTNEDEGDSAKGGTTDGITKICSYLEIGIDVFKGNPNAQPRQATPTAQPAAAKYATQEQKDAIIKALNNPVFTKEEKDKIIPQINNYSPETAEKNLKGLEARIEQRVNEKLEASKELTQFLNQNKELIPAEESKKYFAMMNDPKVQAPAILKAKEILVDSLSNAA